MTNGPPEDDFRKEVKRLLNEIAGDDFHRKRSVGLVSSAGVPNLSVKRAQIDRRISLSIGVVLIGCAVVGAFAVLYLLQHRGAALIALGAGLSIYLIGTWLHVRAHQQLHFQSHVGPPQRSHRRTGLRRVS